MLPRAHDEIEVRPYVMSEERRDDRTNSFVWSTFNAGKIKLTEEEFIETMLPRADY